MLSIGPKIETANSGNGEICMHPKDPTSAEHRQDMERVFRILEDTQPIDRTLAVSKEEFQARTRNVNSALQRHGHKVGIVFSDEHYCGDVPYLGGNMKRINRASGGRCRTDGVSYCCWT